MLSYRAGAASCRHKSPCLRMPCADVNGYEHNGRSPSEPQPLSRYALRQRFCAANVSTLGSSPPTDLGACEMLHAFPSTSGARSADSRGCPGPARHWLHESPTDKASSRNTVVATTKAV